MKRFFTNSLTIASLTILVITTSACGYRWKTPEERADWMAEKITDELELNTDQQAKLNSLKNVMLSAEKDMRDRRLDQREQILTLLDSPTLDRQALDTMFDQNIDLMQKHRPDVINAMGDFYDSLDEDQQKELREYYREYSEDWERYGHHRRHFWW